MKKLIAILAAASALVVVGASPAQAVLKTDYEVIVEGKASYAHSQLLPVIQGEWTRQEEASFKWRTRFPLVSFVGKGLGAVSAAPTTTVTAPAATSHESLPKPEGAMTADCSGNLLAAPSNGAWFGAASAPDLDPNTEDVGIRLLGDVSIVLPSCSGVLYDIDWVNVHSTDHGLGAGPFDAEFSLPHEAIDMDRIIQLLEGSESGALCPNYKTLTTLSCALTWKATVTFIRTAQSELGPGGEADDDIVVPLPPKPPVPVSDDDLIVPIPTGKLDAGAKQAKLTVTCSVGCTGSAAAYLPGQGARASSARARASSARASASSARALAKARFAAKPGRPTTVTLRFPARVRPLIRRAGGIRVAINAVAPSGGGKIQRAVAIRLPRAGR